MKPDKLEERFTQPDGWHWKWVKGSDGAMLRSGSLYSEEKGRAHIVYVEGMGEFAEKTFELSREFNQNGLNFHVIDRRGQGLSGRYLSDEFKIHAHDFRKDARDLVNFVRDTIPEDEPVILLGHSTGGLISLIAMHEDPARFSGAFLTSPLLGFYGGVTRRLERLISKFDRFRFGRKYLPGGGPWSEEQLEKYRFMLSSDPHRNSLKKTWHLINPDLRTGSATLGFAAVSARAMRMARHPDYLKGIKAPVHIVSAGNEFLVDTASMVDVVKRLPKGSYSHIPNGKHELLMETDDIRTPLIRQVFDFVDNHTPAP